MHPKLQIAAWTTFTVVVLAWIVFWLVPFASKSNDLSKADKADRVTFDCDRGFHEADWKAERLKTGQSIAKCDWAKGWTPEHVTTALGKPSRTKGTSASQWTLAASSGSNGGGNWVLTLGFDLKSGNVTGAKTQTLRI